MHGQWLCSVQMESLYGLSIKHELKLFYMPCCCNIVEFIVLAGYRLLVGAYTKWELICEGWIIYVLLVRVCRMGFGLCATGNIYIYKGHKIRIYTKSVYIIFYICIKLFELLLFLQSIKSLLLISLSVDFLTLINLWSYYLSHLKYYLAAMLKLSINLNMHKFR